MPAPPVQQSSRRSDKLRTPAAVLGILTIAISLALRAQTGSETLDHSKVKFVMARCSEDGYNRGAFVRAVGGVVASDIDLKNDKSVQDLIASGARFAISECPSERIPFGQITVILRNGDPN